MRYYLWLTAFWLTGCAVLLPRMPSVDLADPGWTVREGQAIWCLPESKGEIAGEILVATKGDGSAFVQFTKPPFPFVVAQSSAAQWEAEFPTKNKRYAGRGAPPMGLIWLQLARVLAGRQPPKDWNWSDADRGWRLENPHNGEVLEGYFGR